MRYPASEKLEIIRLVEQSHLPVQRTLRQIGIPRATFYRWYDQYRDGGPEALEDRPSRPDRVWNRIPDESTILDDFSRYIIAWKLCTTMTADDVTETLELALASSGCDQARVRHKPRLLTDKGSSYIATDLADWLDKRKIEHIRGAPCHPQTQGKIERWHLTLKNRILLENYYLPGDLTLRIEAFVDDYNHRRYHESLKNLTPADVYSGRGQTILLERERIKRKTIQHRRLLHQSQAA